MSDGSLSQDEIDALLAGTGSIDLGESGGGGGGSTATKEQVAALEQVLRSTVAQQQSNMSMLTGANVIVSPPIVKTGSPGGLRGTLVQVIYEFGDFGHHSYVLSGDDALALAGASMGLEEIELDDAALNAIQEVFSQVSGPVINALSDKTGATIMPQPAEAASVQASGLTIPSDVVHANYSITLGDNEFPVYELFAGSFVARLSGGGGGGRRG